METVTKAMIVKGLRSLGIKTGDILTVHSSLSSFGKVQGGAATVVDALVETIGREGTLVMSSLPVGFPYNYRTTPTNVGTVAEHFRKMRGVARSMCPCVTAAALGPRAREFVENHHKCKSPYIGSPYDLAAIAGGYVLLLGVDQDRSTTLHCAEAYARVPYMNPAEARYVDEEGRVQTYRGVLYAGPHRNFIGVERLLREAGLVKRTKIGKCVVRLMKGKELIDFCVAQLRKNPTLFLTNNEGYYDGIRQRGMVRAARIGEEENFTLVARTSTAGRNMEEVIWHALRAGVSALEVDHVSGRDVTKMRKGELGWMSARVRERNLRIAIVRTNVLTDGAFAESVRVAQTLHADAVITPLTGTARSLKERVKAGKKAGVQVLFENAAIGFAAVKELMEKLGKDAALAFNPGNFAAAGELAFLESFRPLRKYVRYVAITDATRMGAPCLPGNGNGEVKEIMSILRCGTFDGYFSLGCVFGAGLEFDAIADAFHKQLDES